MAFDQLEQQVETFLGCQIRVELIVRLVGSFKACENLGDALHQPSLPDSRLAHQNPPASLHAHASPGEQVVVLALERGNQGSLELGMQRP